MRKAGNRNPFMTGAMATAPWNTKDSACIAVHAAVMVFPAGLYGRRDPGPNGRQIVSSGQRDSKGAKVPVDGGKVNGRQR